MGEGPNLPEVDEGLCLGYGLCNDYAPGLFVLESDGISRAQREAIDISDPATRDRIRAAVEGCPTAAIIWDDPEL